MEDKRLFTRGYYGRQQPRSGTKEPTQEEGGTQGEKESEKLECGRRTKGEAAYGLAGMKPSLLRSRDRVAQARPCWSSLSRREKQVSWARWSTGVGDEREGELEGSGWREESAAPPR